MYSDQSAADNFGIDMFGRLKVSNPFTLFDSTHRYATNGDYSDEIVGTSSVTHLVNESTDSLNIGTALGDKVTRESKNVFAYQPGKSLQTMQSFVMAPAKAGLRQRVGYFSRSNGIYLEQDGLTTNLVVRTSTSGSVEEIRVPRSSWDRTTLVRDRDHDIELDMSAAQIFFIEIEWLGVGSVKCGFVIGGEFYAVHQFDHANWIKKVYMTTAALPLRYEIENTAATASASSMKQICATVISNGGYDWQRRSYTVRRDSALAVTTTIKPLIAIRMATGRTDSVIIPADFSVFPPTAGDYIIVLLKNPTLVGGTWVAGDGDNVEYNIDATSVTGGSILTNTYTQASNKSTSVSEIGGISRLFMQLGRTNEVTPVSDILVLATRTITGTGTAVGSFSWYDNL